MDRSRVAIVVVLAVLLGLLAARMVWRALEPLPAVASAPPPAAPEPEPLVSRIPAGMRAVTIRVDDVSGVSRELEPGDLVDVIATSPIGDEKGGRVSRVLLERVPILELGRAPESARARGRSWTVALLVSPQEAMAVAAAGDARFLLAARNPGDDAGLTTRELAFTRDEGPAAYRASERDVVGRIEPGMRAVTIEVRDTDGIAGMLRRGDRVDVVLTSPFSRFQSAGLEPGAAGRVSELKMASRIILQDVEVLATEKGLTAGVEDARPVRRVTLLATPADAERLTVASDATARSVLRLLARHRDDRDEVRTGGQSLSGLLSTRRESQRVEIIHGRQITTRPVYE